MTHHIQPPTSDYINTEHPESVKIKYRETDL